MTSKSMRLELLAVDLTLDDLVAPENMSLASIGGSTVAGDTEHTVFNRERPWSNQKARNLKAAGAPPTTH